MHSLLRNKILKKIKTVFRMSQNLNAKIYKTRFALSMHIITVLCCAFPTIVPSQSAGEWIEKEKESISANKWNYEYEFFVVAFVCLECKTKLRPDGKHSQASDVCGREAKPMCHFICASTVHQS